MKNILSIILASAFLLGACSKDYDGPVDLETVPLPLILIEDGASTLIQDPLEFESTFTVDLYFKDAPKPQKLDVVVAMNGDYTNIVVLRPDITTYPTTISVTGAQLAALFGMTAGDIVPGDYFEIRANTTTLQGKTYPAFVPNGFIQDSTIGIDTLPVPIDAYAPDAFNFDGSSPSITYRAVCPLDLEAFVGTFTLDDPDFWGGSYPVTIVREGENVLKISGWVEDPAGVVRVTIDLETQTATVPSQVYIPFIAGLPYNNYTAEGDGIVDACNTGLTLSIENTVDEGSFGASSVTISKP